MRSALFLVLLVYSCLLPRADAQQIWLDALTTQSDWDQLFTDTPAWAAVARRLAVYETSNEYIESASDADLIRMGADLSKRGIKLAVALQPVEIDVDHACGIGEGYSLLRENTAGAAKLHRLGIAPSIIVFDEPLWFGHFSPDRTSCRFPVPELVSRVAKSASEYLTRFPHLVVGDIEPFPAVYDQASWRADYTAFSRQLGTALRTPISFLQTDVDWDVPSHLASLEDAGALSRGLGQKFGVIYYGSLSAASGQEWVSDAIAHFEDVEGAGHPIPDQAIVATWDRNPPAILPETDPAALTHVIAVYQLPRTDIVAKRVPGMVRGRLLDASGKPVADARISLLVVGSYPARLPSARVAQGHVPVRARYALMGLRVNSECFCAGPNDLLVGDFTYSEQYGRTVTFSLLSVFEQRHFKPFGRIGLLPIDGLSAAGRLVVPPDQQVVYNSPEFPVTPGSTFSFSARIGSLSGGGLFGSVPLIWLDSGRRDFLRTTIKMALDTTTVAQAVTDRSGRFTLPTPEAQRGSRQLVRIVAGETRSARGTVADLH